MAISIILIDYEKEVMQPIKERLEEEGYDCTVYSLDEFRFSVHCCVLEGDLISEICLPESYLGLECKTMVDKFDEIADIKTHDFKVRWR